jgi:hypothetical protein
MLNRPLFGVLPDLRDQVFPKLLDGVFTTGTANAGKETPAVFDRGGGRSETVYFNFLYTAFRNATAARSPFAARVPARAASSSSAFPEWSDRNWRPRDERRRQGTAS